MTSPSRVPPVTPADVLEVWFDGTDLGVAPRSELQRRWFMPDPAFDAELTTLFSALFDDLDAVEAWADTPAGALAAIVVFDQVSRNLFRGGARAFATGGVITFAGTGTIRTLPTGGGRARRRRGQRLESREAHGARPSSSRIAGRRTHREAHHSWRDAAVRGSGPHARRSALSAVPLCGAIRDALPGRREQGQLECGRL